MKEKFPESGPAEVIRPRESDADMLFHVAGSQRSEKCNNKHSELGPKPRRTGEKESSSNLRGFAVSAWIDFVVGIGSAKSL